MLIIGDVHGKVNDYWKIIQKYKDQHSIQVGDFGFKKEHEWFLGNIDCKKHKINFGNHDDSTYLNKAHSMGDYSFDQGIMTIRGAYSIDKSFRTENIDWWANEELNYQEMQMAIDFYELNKPKIIISHDCPHEVRQYLFGINDKSMTTNGLQSMFEIHQPDIWIFGHHHKSRNDIINKTQFTCLAELETKIL